MNSFLKLEHIIFLSEWNSFIPAVAINFSLSETLDKCCEILTFYGDDCQDYIVGGDVLWFGRRTLTFWWWQVPPKCWCLSMTVCNVMSWKSIVVTKKSVHVNEWVKMCVFSCYLVIISVILSHKLSSKFTFEIWRWRIIFTLSWVQKIM